MASVVVLASVVLAGLLSGCSPTFDGLRLRIASGSSQGVYHALSDALADAWRDQLRIPRPDVLVTEGSVENIEKLCGGLVDVGFSAADAMSAVEHPAPSGCALRALARMHDDYFQVVVRDESPIRTLADLRGKRVSTGSESSGVHVIAGRLLEAAGISASSDIKRTQLSFEDSLNALRSGTIDAFFWSGGLPTGGISVLAKTVHLRLVDISDVLPGLRRRYPVYGTASVPISTYGLPSPPVITLVVRNYLLVTSAMHEDVAEALVRAMFKAHERLVSASPTADTIDPRSAIETIPIPLHPGAERYYRSIKE